MPISPPRPRGPHLNALRAFEAAARLGGFAAAAEELSVTPGAISQHVKALEDWAGAPLFERRSQGVALTPLGAGVAADFSGAFDRLGEAQRRLRGKAGQTAISIAALPSVAQLWLSPRLPAIREAAPGPAISVTALERAPNLRREMFDISLFLRAPTHAAGERILSDDPIFPVCAPEIAARLASPADLAGEALLRDATWREDWALWLGHAGHPDLAGRDGPSFSLYAIAVEEALNGAGVLIGHGALLERHLAAGALVAPFATRCASGKALILETSATAPSGGALERLCDMLAA